MMCNMVTLRYASVVLAALCLQILPADSLSSSSSSRPTSGRKPIQKIAIVGSGIAGLSLAHAFENQQSGIDSSDFDVVCFDGRSNLDTTSGAGVQLNGGMAILKQISPDLQRSVVKASLPLTEIRSKTANWLDPDQDFELLKFDLKGIIQEAGGDVEKALIQDGETMAYTMMRGALQQVLYDKLQKTPVTLAKQVTDISALLAAEGGNDIYLTFSDGSTQGPFDMVVGCDGVNSVVKEYVRRGQISAAQTSSSNGKTKVGSPALYSGIRIRYAIQDADESEVGKTATLKQFFGSGAYCLTGSYGNGPNKYTKCCFTIFLDPEYLGPFKRKSTDGSAPSPNKLETTAASAMDDENVDWAPQEGSIQQRMIDQINLSGTPSKETTAIISEADRFFELGVYFHNPFSIRGWSREVVKGSDTMVTLCGDAAHAMPPFLGQGANQAIQDAYCLAAAIRKYNGNAGKVDQSSLKSLLKDEYESKRWASTTSITAKAGVLGYLEASSGPLSKFRDAFFFTMNKSGIAKKIFLDAAIPKI